MRAGKERSFFPAFAFSTVILLLLGSRHKTAFQSANFLDPKRQIQPRNYVRILSGLGRGRSPKTQHLQGFEA